MKHRAAASRSSGTAQRLEGPEGKDAGDLKLTYPMRGQVVKFFGYNEGVMNNGLDISNKAGTDVTAPGEGLIVYCGERGAYGFVVDIDHGNDIITRYAHASRLHANVGDIIKRGQHIADIGSTGRSTGPHLHFEVRVKGVPQNPHKFLSAGSDQAKLLALAGH